jgi:uncharacterized protein YndB with AHSA1/START domain
VTGLPTATAGAMSTKLSLTRVYDAPRDLVFDVWTEPKHLVNWWGPSEYSLAHCEVDFRVGGSYRICMRSPEGDDHWVGGSYREIDPPRKISFTWTRENISGEIWCDNIVTVTFDDIDGMTKFSLRQGRFENVDLRDQHNYGWDQCLDRLGQYVTVPTSNSFEFGN